MDPTDTRPPAPGRRRILTILIPAAVSVGLVVWILWHIQDPRRVRQGMAGASLLPLLLIVPASFLSHWLRGVRWRRLIGRPVPRFYCFTSVMIGNAVNDVLPRGGEVARVVNLWRITGTPAPGLVATLVAERIVDVILLLAFLGLSLVLEGDRIAEAFPMLAAVGPTALGAAAAGAAAIVWMAHAGEGLARFVERLARRVHPRLASGLGRIVREGAEGFAIVRRPRDAILALGESLLIWGLYLACLLLGLAAFHLLGRLGLGGGTVWFSITSSSLLIPSQGAIGVYHKFGQDALHLLYGIDPDIALACVTVVHAILFLGVGGIGGAAVWGLQAVVRRRA